MSFDDLTDQYITYESRLSSFHKSAKKRGSTASGRGTKALNWPHKSITPASLARAGLFFNPTPQNPDNATCFLCHKGLDGWEANDDPLVEHLKHAPECGWAVVAAIESEVGDYAQEDPDQPYMKEARKATFAGRWPHDSKKGWKCKTKQLVDAGWKYTPTEDSDDMATCAYCQLALDGWEPGDKPLEEHYNRSPDCPFFVLLEESQSTKKPSRAKAGRASKASRLSGQSVATIASEAPSINESTVTPEDSVLTTSSTAQGGKKAKGRKATTTKGKKTKTKKETRVEDVEASIEEEAPPKPSRGKKRDSTAVEDTSLATSEAPPVKKRATRTRASVAVNDSTLEHDEDPDIAEAPAPKKGGKKKATRKAPAKSTRNVSTASVTSEVATAGYEATPGTFPDDDEIERQLEADLERQLTEDEEISLDSDSERAKAKKGKGAKAEIEHSRDYDMLNPEPVEPDEDEVDDELRALQAEMEVDEPEPEHEPQPEPEAEPEPEPEPEPQELQVPKKGRKAGIRKASKQTKPKKAKAQPEPVEEDEPEPEQDPQPEELDEEVAQPEVQAHVDEQAHEDSLASTDTVVKKSAVSRSSAGKRGRGRPSRASIASHTSADELELVEAPAETSVEAPEEPPAKRARGRPSKASLASRASIGAEESQLGDAPPKRGRGRPSKKSLEARKSMEAAASQEATQPFTQPIEERMQEDVEVYASEEPKDEQPAPRVVSFESAHPSPAAQPVASSPPPSTAHLANPPSTPGRIISPAPSARQAAISPSQSPQSSDAENQPPSSKPTASANPKRVALAPVVSTPTRGSPSKRNVIAGLRSTTPWTELDLDAVFGSPRTNSDKENGVDRYLKQGQTLTSPEKQMTVQEWIYHNASEAEKRLKHECESIVNRFESEGTKAMRVLEGLVVE